MRDWSVGNKVGVKIQMIIFWAGYVHTRAWMFEEQVMRD